MNLAFKPIIESFSDAANGNPFGYEPLWRKLEAFMDNKPSTGGNWPPYNLIQEDGKCVYQFAIAGFKKEDIRVELDRVNSFLSIVGGKKSGKVDTKKSSGLNMVLLIQVPLKQKVREVQKSMSLEVMAESNAVDMAAPAAASDVEAAVIGHGQFEGPFTEIDNLSIERDDRFPVRVTVQFYEATATGNADEADIKQIKEEIDSVLSAGDAAGSLVVAGETGRITEYEGVKVQPAGWWNDFWKRHEQNTGESADKAIARLMKLLGKDYLKQPVCELYVAEKLRFGK